MKSFAVVAIALFGCALAVEQVAKTTSSVSYSVPSGSVSYTTSVGSDSVHGVYGQGVYGQGGVYAKAAYAQGVQPSIATVQQTKYVQQPYVHFDQVQPVVPQAKPVEYVQPAVKHVEYVQPAVKNVEYVPSFVGSTVVKPVDHHVQPIVKRVDHVVKPVEGFVQPFVKPVEYFQPFVRSAVPFVKPVDYVQPAVKYVQQRPVFRPFEYVQPTGKFVQPVVKSVEHVQPVVDRFVQPVVKPVVPVQTGVKYVVPPVVQPAVRYAQSVGYVQPHEHLVQNIPAIVRMNQDASFDGRFNYGFESEDGITTVAAGAVKPVEGSDDVTQVMTGSYSYTAPDGTPVQTVWYADETGFHAEGNHLPVAPPMPEAIARSVQYLRSLPVKTEDVKYEEH